MTSGGGKSIFFSSAFHAKFVTGVMRLKTTPVCGDEFR